MNFDSRKYVIITFFVLTGILYVSKLFYMQVLDDSWKLRAQQIAEHRREITPPRAVVFDRNGVKVVENKTYYNLMMVEADVSEDMDTLAFAKLIGWTKQEIIDRYKAIVKGEGTYTDPFTKKVTKNYQEVRPYPFIKELTDDEMSKIVPHLENFPGFYEEVASMRNYPFANGANILGYLTEATREEVDNDPFIVQGIRSEDLELNVIMKISSAVSKA